MSHKEIVHRVIETIMLALLLRGKIVLIFDISVVLLYLGGL